MSGGGYYEYEGKPASSWGSDNFCSSMNTVIDLTGVSTVELTVDMWNEDSSSGINFGHPGIMFNVQDSNNFDVVYIR